MGVTIHFEGKLKSDNEYDLVLQAAIRFAENNSLPYFLLSEEGKLLKRVKNEEDWDYVSFVKGIQIQPHENADPLILEFDNNNYIQDYCKTQFVDIEIHVLIINFFRCIESHFQLLNVVDEGEYWDTNDCEILQKHIDTCFDQMDVIKAENPKIEGPFRMEDGRIIDLME